MSAIDFFLRDLNEERARDAVVVAHLRDAPADELSRMVADLVIGRRVKTFVASGAVYIDGATICRIDAKRLGAVQQRRARRLISIVAMVLSLLLPIAMILMASLRH